MTAKKNQDPIDALPPISRKVLENAPPNGRYQVPYTVGRLFVSRGWGDHLGKNNMGIGRLGRGMPQSQFQLNTAGLNAADTARKRSWSDIDRLTYEAVHTSTLEGMSALLEDHSLDELIRRAEGLVNEILASVQLGHRSTAGARGYLDALVQYRDQQAEVTA